LHYHQPLNVLHNYFDSPTKLSNLYLTKFLDTSTKLFFPCICKSKEIKHFILQRLRYVFPLNKSNAFIFYKIISGKNSCVCHVIFNFWILSELKVVSVYVHFMFIQFVRIRYFLSSSIVSWRSGSRPGSLIAKTLLTFLSIILSCIARGSDKIKVDVTRMRACWRSEYRNGASLISKLLHDDYCRSFNNDDHADIREIFFNNHKDCFKFQRVSKIANFA